MNSPLSILSRVLRQVDRSLNRLGQPSLIMHEMNRLPTVQPRAVASRNVTDLWNDLDREMTSFTSPVQFPMDIVENEKEYQARIDMPSGITKDDLTVQKSVEDRTVTVSAERTNDWEEKQDNFFLKERSWGRLQRTFAVPDEVDIERIKVRFDSGVLQVDMPKQEQNAVNSNAEKIEIE
ncbi:SHSP domain-containing protein [Plasmodiophora brassicae]|uniref:SHSP domain-containing protein n=1 Tax=Plasmodiophora brassicae TaxID=37360 RepID=A0A0G4IS23_PLABS|nr:hypothetical protein PBRA_006164 [Plasmodiophora brassicae]SPQ96129.1 unnamed protein product [Plasmodiophora brassicae]